VSSGLDVLGALSASMPQAPGPGEDPGLVVVGTVYAIDVPNVRVQVMIRGALMWLPAEPGRYRVAATTLSVSQGKARVLVSSTTGRPVLVLGPVDSDAAVQAGTVTATASSPPTVTLTLRGVSRTLPAIPSTYTVSSQAWVLTDDWGTPVLVLGPTTAAADGTPTAPTPPPGATTVAFTTTISPTWSSTWEVKVGHWTDEGSYWNTGRYGGSSTLYEGDKYGSGSLRGLATYGDQIVNLGALSIQSIGVAVRGVGLSPADAGSAVTLQGAPYGSKPAGMPAASGDTVTVVPGPGPLQALTSPMCEALRTGAAKSLALVGATYAACAGAGNGDGMVLTVTGTRAA